MVTALEKFQLEVLEVTLTALRMKDLRLPDAPAFMPVKVAIDLILILERLEPSFQKAINLLYEMERCPACNERVPSDDVHRVPAIGD